MGHSVVGSAHTAKRVLVADDDKDIREVMCDLLTDAEYEVIVSSDGAMVLTHLRSWPGHQVIFLDWMMAGVDGLQVLRTVARDPDLRQGNIFILMTAGGKTLPLDLVHLISDLNVGMLTKPFEIDHVLAMTDDAFKRLATGQAGGWWSAPGSREG